MALAPQAQSAAMLPARSSAVVSWFVKCRRNPLVLVVLRTVIPFLIWEAVTRLLSVPPYLLPKPTEIFSAMADQRLQLLYHLRVTAVEALAGFMIGSLFSIAFGLLVVYRPLAKQMFMPYMVVIQTMPKVALAPLFVIWLGFSLTTNIVYTALIAFFPVLVNFIQGLEDVNPSEQRLMASYNASKWQMFTHVHIHRSIPYLFAGLKMAAVLALIGAVVSEFVAGDSGLGYYMVQSQNLLKTKEAFSALLILTVMGLLFYVLVDVIHRALTPWARDSRVVGTDVV
jgi:NitT/TauT family transport system permease protein